MKRIFIAVKIDPADTLLDMLSVFRTGLKDERIKWTDSKNFHITLAFLGDTNEDKIERLSKMLNNVSTESGAFEMILKGAGIFKNFGDPRVIWTGIEHSEKLDRLHKSVKQGLKNTGLILEERAFRPHLTLGRIKSIKEINILKSLIERYLHTEIQIQPVTEVILYESILLPEGPLYIPLEKYSLL